MEDVVRHLGVSRRLADLRFREAENRTIHGAILEARLRLAEKKLRNPRSSVSIVAQESGFRSVKTFEAAFVRRNGLSPRAWRARLSAR